MTYLSRLNPYWLWALLALPAAGMLTEWSGSSDPRIAHELLHPSGEFAARFMIIAMMATPLTLLFRGWRGPRWLVRNRRYFGVAAFGYALLHTVLYIVDEGTLSRILGDIGAVEIWTGWMAFFIFIPLAVTSADYFVRTMGTAWKRLQRWTYAAAVLTLVHWASLHDWRSPGAALVHFAPLALLSLYRLWWTFDHRRKRALAAG